MNARAWIQRAEAAAFALAAAACAVIGLRIMVESVSLVRAPKPEAAAPPSVPPLVELASELLDEPKPIEEKPAPAVQARSGDPGTPLRLTLSVVVGPERSEIYVNGARLGLSPYLGDFTCKQGEDLRIEVVPRSQALIERQAKCVGKNVFIRD